MNQQQNYPPPQQGYPPPPKMNQQGYPPPPTMNQQQGYQPPPPNYNATQQQYHTEESGKGVQPSSGWNDVWATVLWLINLGAFIALAVIAIRTYRNTGTSYNGVQSQEAYSGLTFDTSTFKIFGLSAIVGFGLSFLYLIIANM